MQPGTGNVRDFTENLFPNEGLCQIIRFLLNASENFSFSFNEEKTILSVLKVQISSIVIDKEADINVTVDFNSARHNVLSVVLNNYFPPHPESGEIANWLLDHGASIEFTHPSALIKAIIVNNANLVKKLIHSGMRPADVRVPSSGTLTPLNVALTMRQETLVTFFVEHSFLTPSDAHTISCYLTNNQTFTPPKLLELSAECSSILIGIKDREKKMALLSSEIPEPCMDEIENALGHIVLHSEEVDIDIVERLLIAVYRSVPFMIWRNQMYMY